MNRTSHLSLACAVTICVGLSSFGCGGRDTSRNAVAQSSSGVVSDSIDAESSSLAIDYAEVVREARSQYRYDPVPLVLAADPGEFDDPDPKSPNPTLEFWTATPIAGGAQKYVIVGRIVSDEDVPKRGILKDTNYVWADRSKPNKKDWKLYIIPQDSPLQRKEWKVKQKKGFKGGTHPGVHLLKAQKTVLRNGKRINGFSFGLCTDDCPTGHCGFQ